ncbi:hypothetical protein BC833DRAFT_562163 [Globomyces pollinis-pini]|nr:hypothetical protein BC833DRAFT_562163 [Globomyces pollinis-pini]
MLLNHWPGNFMPWSSFHGESFAFCLEKMDNFTFIEVLHIVVNLLSIVLLLVSITIDLIKNYSRLLIDTQKQLRITLFARLVILLFHIFQGLWAYSTTTVIKNKNITLEIQLQTTIWFILGAAYFISIGAIIIFWMIVLYWFNIDILIKGPTLVNRMKKCFLKGSRLDQFMIGFLLYPTLAYIMLIITCNRQPIRMYYWIRNVKSTVGLILGLFSGPIIMDLMNAIVSYKKMIDQRNQNRTKTRASYVDKTSLFLCNLLFFGIIAVILLLYNAISSIETDINILFLSQDPNQIIRFSPTRPCATPFDILNGLFGISLSLVFLSVYFKKTNESKFQSELK